MWFKHSGNKHGVMFTTSKSSIEQTSSWSLKPDLKTISVASTSNLSLMVEKRIPTELDQYM